MKNKSQIRYITLIIVCSFISLFLSNSCSENTRSDQQKKTSISDSLMYSKYFKELDSIQKLIEEKRIELRIIQKDIEADNNRSTPLLKSADIKEKTSYDSVLEKLDQLNNALSKIENEKYALQSEFNKTRQQSDSINLLLEKSLLQNEQHQFNLNTLHESGVQLEQEINDLQTDKLAISQNLSDNKLELEENRLRIETYKQESERLSTQMAETESSKLLLEKRLDETKRRLEAKNLVLNSKDDTSTEIKAKLIESGLKTAFVQANEEATDEKSILIEVQHLKKSIESLQFEKKELQNQLDESKKQTAEIYRKSEIVVQDKHKLTLEIQEITSQRKNDSLFKELNVLLATIDSLQNEKAVRNEKIIAITDSVDNIIPVTLFEDYYPLNTSRTKIKLRNQDEITQFIQSYIEKYLAKKTALKHFELKEYFFFYIDTSGNVIKIDDERTEFNNNSKIFKAKDIDAFKDFKFSPVIINSSKTHAKVSIAIHINVTQTKYDYKIQKDKLRIYKNPLYVEYVEPGDIHYSMIADTIKGYLNITDKFNITILDGSYSVIEYSKKEYNPFYKEKKILINSNILKITKLRGIR